MMDCFGAVEPHEIECSRIPLEHLILKFMLYIFRFYAMKYLVPLHQQEEEVYKQSKLDLQYRFHQDRDQYHKPGDACKKTFPVTF